MIRSVADTHAFLWYLYNDPRLSEVALKEFRDALAAGDQIAVSSITLVEIAYLVERKRIPADALSVAVEALDYSAVFVEVPVDRRVALLVQSVDGAEVRDMPDRLIEATALAGNFVAGNFGIPVPVISKDRKIQASNVMTIW